MYRISKVVKNEKGRIFYLFNSFMDYYFYLIMLYKRFFLLVRVIWLVSVHNLYFDRIDIYLIYDLLVPRNGIYKIWRKRFVLYFIVFYSSNNIYTI